MKKMKSGFSLAELLIGLVIAAIIATMGMTVAKRGIENSYDAYIYTGYKGISDAISEANAEGFSLEYSNVGGCDFTNAILRMFNVADDKITSRNTASIRFTTPNNITYNIRTSGITGSEANENRKEYYVIKIWFPTPNLKEGQERRNAEFVYAPNDDYGVLLPIPKTQPEYGTKEYQNSLWNLAKRRDLLMFYIDDGRIGRVGANNQYVQREYLSLNDALCRTGKQVGVTNFTKIKVDLSDLKIEDITRFPDISDLIMQPSQPRAKSRAINNTTSNYTKVETDRIYELLVNKRTLFENPSGNDTKINDCSIVGRGDTVGAIRMVNPRKG